MTKDDVILAIAVKGRVIGFCMVLLPLMWDIFGTGVRGFMEYGLGRWAILCQVIGIAIMGISFALDKKLR